MKKSLITSLLIIFTSISFSQTKLTKTIATKVTTNCTADISCSQKFGITETENEYVLTVVYNNTTVKFTTSGGPNMTSYNIAKKTPTYVIGLNEEGNYSFFDIKKKQFYNIDYYMNRHIISGYGSQTNEIKETVLRMMKIIKNGNSQKDAIQHLIKQTEYAF